MSTFSSPVPGGKTSPKGFLRVLGKIFTGPGVIESGALTVSAQTTADASVKISGSALHDNAVFIHTDGHFIQSWNDASVTLTIAANSSGVIKTDAIVAYVDLAAGLGAPGDPPNNPGSLKFIAVRRGGSNTGNPTTAEIETAVSGNPYLLLAHVTVNTGLFTINSGNIVDRRTRAYINDDMMGGGSAWTTWSPALNIYGGTVSMGNGVLTGKYTKQGRTVRGWIFQKIGSTTVMTGGNFWYYNLPVPRASNILFEQIVGALLFYDASIVQRYQGTCNMTRTDDVSLPDRLFGRYPNNPSYPSLMDDLATGTSTNGVGDYMMMTFEYESAA